MNADIAPAQANSLWRWLIRIAPVVLMAILVKVANPLGIYSKSDQISIETFNILASGFYPSSAQDKISIVMIDDNSLTDSDISFPPPFPFYARLIESIRSFGAESILLDLMFLEDRGNPGDIERLVKAMDGFPVFLTRAETEGRNCDVRGPGNLAKLRRAAVAEPHPLIEDQASHIKLLPKICDTVVPAASLAVYAYHCAADPGCSKGPNDPFVNPQAFEDEVLALQWGRYSPKEALDLHPSSGRLARDCPQPGLADHLTTFVRTLLRPAGNDDVPVPVGCSYHPVIRAEWLYAPGRFPELNVSAMKSALAGRIVVIGADFAGMKDVGPSPVFGKVQGAWIHAMAIDNLLVRGADFLRPWPEGKLGAVGFDGAFEMVLVALSTLLANWIWKRMPSERLDTAVLCTIGFATGGAAIGLAISFLLVFAWRLEPVNWIGIACAGAILADPAYSAFKKIWHARAMASQS